MIRPFILLLFVTLAASSFAQVKFYKMFSNNGYDYAQSVVELEDSSYLVAGSSSSFSNSADAFLMKLDSAGSFLWSNHYGSGESESCRRVLNLNDSIFYLLGESYTDPVSGFNIYGVKTDSNGVQLDEKRIFLAGWQRTNDAILGNDNFIYIVGESTQSADENVQLFLMKMTTDLDTVWTRTFGSVGDDRFFALAQQDDTTLIAVGEYYAVDSAETKACIFNFSLDGDIRWQKIYGSDGETSAHDLFFSGSLIQVVGRSQPATSPDDDIYLLSTTSDGTLVYEDQYHSDGDVSYDEVTPYGTPGRIYIGSVFQNEYSAGNTIDAAITRFYSGLYWDAAYVNVGFLGKEYIRDLKPTRDGGAVAVGYSEDSGNGGAAVYILKIGPNDDFPTVTNLDVEDILSIHESQLTTFSVFPNPSTGSFRLKTSVPGFLTIIDALGNMLQSAQVNGEAEFNVSWAPGMYILRFESASGSEEIQKVTLR